VALQLLDERNTIWRNTRAFRGMTATRPPRYLYDQTRRYFTAMMAGQLLELTSGPPPN
jgi:hypothetical protein